MMGDKVKAWAEGGTNESFPFQVPIKIPLRKLLRVALATIWLQVLCAGGQAAGQTATKPRPAGQATKKAPSPFTEAESLLEQGSLEAAKSKTLELIKLHPTSATGYKLLGIIYSEEKDYAKAQEAFQQAVTVEPRSAGLHNNLGNIYLAQGNAILAEKEFRKALVIEPSNRDGNYNLGLLLMANGKPGEAALHFQRVKPQDLPTRIHLTKAYLQAGKTAEGIKTARDISTTNKDDAQIHLALGVLLAAEKEWREAQRELERANALQPETFGILYNLGQVYLRGGELPKAELILNRALKVKPDSPEALYVLAQVYQERKRAVDALDLLVRAHKLAPDNTDVIFLLARVSMSQNYFEDAIPLLEAGLKIAPQRADLRAALGESFFMAGQAGKAIEEFEKLIVVDPTSRSFVFLGLSYRHLGKFDEAKKYFQEGLKKNPHDAACLFNIGYIEERQGNISGAEKYFQDALRADADYPEALLELANLRITAKRYEEAAELLRKYVKVSRDAAGGYYKLAMVERNLHQMEAAQRDLTVFQSLSKETSAGPYPYQHLFDYVDNRSNLSSKERTLQDLTELQKQIEKHPDQPRDQYLLAEAYLKLGKIEEARKTIAALDEISSSDYRTQTGIGVLLARWHLYTDAIQHFQNALKANPDSDDVKFDLADAYFRKGQHQEALGALQQVSEKGQQDDAYLTLLGDVHSHLGDPARAAEIFQDAIRRSPDNDQNYLSLTLVELRRNNLSAAEKTLQSGLERIPSSGKILWGMGIVSALEGNTTKAQEHFVRAVDLLPEWPGSYSTLGVFYYQTGQIDKAREVLNRFKGTKSTGGFDLDRIEEALSKAPPATTSEREPMPIAARQQLLQLAFVLADRTL